MEHGGHRLNRSARIAEDTAGHDSSANSSAQQNKIRLYPELRILQNNKAGAALQNIHVIGVLLRNAIRRQFRPVSLAARGLYRAAHGS